MSLQDEIERLEGMIADRRELYNDQVYRHNTRIAQVPAVFLAWLFGWRARPFFEASDAERERPETALGTDGDAAGGPEAAAGERRDAADPRPPRRDRVVRVGATHRPDGHPADRGRHRAGPTARRAARGAAIRGRVHEPAVAGARDVPDRRPRPRRDRHRRPREWDYGVYEGRTTDDIRNEEPGWTIWTADVRGGESVEDVGQRVDRVIDAALAADGDVALFGHGHCLRILAARWIGLPPADGALLELSTATVSRLGWERERRVVELWNGGSHLARD